MSEEQNKLNSIKSWSVDDRPREKMISKGRHSLSDSELLAIILGSGSKGESAVELAKRILSDHQNNLNDLGKLSIKDYVKKYRGVGEAKAINIIATLELGRRRKETQPAERKKLTCSKEAFEIFYPLLCDLTHEEFWVVFCNNANKIIHTECVGKGSIDRVVVDIRMIAKLALDHHATALFVAHNHPSGNLVPSSSDKTITKNLKDACSLFKIIVCDHLIIGENNYYSFADEGII